MKDGKIASRCFIVPSGSGAETLEVVKKTLDAIAQPVKTAVQSPTDFSAGMRMDDWLHPELARTIEYSVGIIARIPNQRLAFGVDEELLGDRGFMLLSGRDFEVERLTARRCDGVNFC